LDKKLIFQYYQFFSKKNFLKKYLKGSETLLTIKPTEKY